MSRLPARLHKFAQLSVWTHRFFACHPHCTDRCLAWSSWLGERKMQKLLGLWFCKKMKIVAMFLVNHLSDFMGSNEITIGHCSAVLHSTMGMTAGQHDEHHGQLNMDMFIRSEDCWLQRCFYWSEWRPQVATWNLENFRASEGCGISRHCRMSQWCGCEPSTQPKKCTSIGWSREVTCWLRYLFPASRQFLNSEIFHGMIRVACDGYKRPK